MGKYRVKLLMSGTIIDVVEADNKQEAMSKLASEYLDFNVDDEEVEKIQ